MGASRLERESARGGMTRNDEIAAHTSRGARSVPSELQHLSVAHGKQAPLGCKREYLTPVSLPSLRSLHQTLARELGIRIVRGAYKAGDFLEREIDACERLGVSRTAYREAVRALAAKGLIEARPKIGTRVLARERWHLLDPDVLSWIFQSEPDIIC